MRPDDVIALGEVAGDMTDGITEHVADVHEAIADRVYGAVPFSTPVRIVHTAIQRSVHATVRTVGGGAAKAAGRALGAIWQGRRPMDANPIGNQGRAALNGFFGDLLVDTDNALALSMGLRRPPGLRGAHPASDVEVSDFGLFDAYPDATGKLVVFVHGMAETEDSWSWFAERTWGHERENYGTKLRREHGFTPLYVRYNTGMRISDNGRDLSDLLDDVLRVWPVGVQQLALVGHSMGGLVVRAAIDAASRPDAHTRWGDVLTDAFLLGAPNEGAPLERGVNALTRLLLTAGETAPYADFLNRRAPGIKDLRHGSVRREDWDGRDPEERLDTRTSALTLPHARLHAIGSSLHPVGTRRERVLGDTLVPWHSASGETSRLPFASSTFLGTGDHFRLVNHRGVYDVLVAALTA